MQYRAYFIDANDQIRAVWPIRASSRDDAVSKAEGLFDQGFVEVWEISARSPETGRCIRRIRQTDA